MAKKTLSREAKKLMSPDAKRTVTTSKTTVVKPVVKPVEVVKAPEPVPVVVPVPVVEPEVPVEKPKRARFVREKKEKRPEVKAAPLPPRSKTAAGKMMSKNVIALPKEESSAPKLGRGTTAF